MLEKFTLSVGLKILGKAWPYLLIAGLTAALMLSRHDLGNARSKIADEATFRHALMGVLEYTKDDGSNLLYAAGKRMKESRDARAALKTISDQVLRNKQAADAADAELKREQLENSKKFAAAQQQIAALQTHKSSGNKDADLKQIEADSQAAWKGWKP